MFVDRKLALKNYIDHANSVLIQYPITETRDTFHLQQSCQATVTGAPTENITLDTTIGMAVDQPFKFTGTLFGGLTNATYYITSITGNVITVTTKIGQPSVEITSDGTTTCNLWYPMNYVTEVDWWAKGYDSSTKAMFEKPTYTDLLTVGNRELYSGDEPLFLTLYDGLIAKVKNNGRGKSETYVWNQTIGWVRIGLERGTYQISEMVYGSAPVTTLKFGWENYGWSNVGWDRNTVVSIITPANEIYRIVRWLTEQVYTNELRIENNRSLMLMFAVIQSQSNQQNNFLPWLNKTSLVDVSQTVRNLLPYKRYQFDNEDLVSGYFNEVKPYHVYIKNFIYKYTVDMSIGVKTRDFDLPAKFNPVTGLFSTPRLVDIATGIPGDYLASDPIWTDPDYADWFNNRNAANPELDPTRKIKTKVKFDRTSVRPSARSWIDQIYNWSPTTKGNGWGALPWSQAVYDVGDQVFYGGAIYRCVISNGDLSFDVSKWTLIQSDDAGINAIDRIASYYGGTDSNVAFTQADYNRLMSNIKYPKITGFNPLYTLGATIGWNLIPSVDTIEIIDATVLTDIVASYVPSTDPTTLGFIFGSAVTYVSGVIDGATSTGSPLTNGNSYWVNVVSATEIALYPTKTDAENDTSRIVLTGILATDQFILGQYPSNTIADDIADNPYWTIDGVAGSGTSTGPLLPGYEPEELVSGVMTDFVNISMTSTGGGSSPVTSVTMSIDAHDMVWNSNSYPVEDVQIGADNYSAVVLPYSPERILMSGLPSTGVYNNGTKLVYGISGKITLTPKYRSSPITIVSGNYTMVYSEYIDSFGFTQGPSTLIILPSISVGSSIDVSYYLMKTNNVVSTAPFYYAPPMASGWY
jgi:hypothetical protein